jgi:tetratricopeptide (TPR) repeat protein
MARQSEVTNDPMDAEQWLGRALRAPAPEGRLSSAEAGLALPPHEIAPDTRVLLLRQAYLAHLEMRQLKRAAEVADQMASVGPLQDVAYNDKARALFASGETPAAIEAQRLAARVAPPARKSFQLFFLATLQCFHGDSEGALVTLSRGLRVAHKDRPLLKAFAAYVELADGKAPEGLAETLAELRAAPCREGYGQFLLGMIAHHMGDRHAAAVHLQAFLDRNAQIDLPKALTLREELRRARMVLAELTSS